MKTTRVLCAVVAVALLAPSLFARGLSKYKDWDQSPQGYFMTKAERAEWETVKSDDDAEKFVNAFLAKRPASFPQEVAERAAQADKYLTIGRLAGSKTNRGRIVVLLGPPQGLDVSTTARTDIKRDNGSMNDALSNFSGAGSSGGRSDSTSNPGSSIATATEVRVYHFKYEGDVAKKVDRKQIDLTIEADPNTGKDRFAKRSDENELDLIQEQLAQASLKK